MSTLPMLLQRDVAQFTLPKRKGKEEYLYSAILADTPLTKRSDMDHTVLPANYTMSAFPS